MTTLSRRALLGTLAAASAALPFGLAGCSGSAAPAAGPSSTGTAGFGWTDARGTVIDIPVPTRIVAQSSAAAALWDAGIKVTGAYGELSTTDGKLDYQAGSLDLDQLTVIGKTYGQFDQEKYAALQPQLLVDLSFDDKTLWYVDEKTLTKIGPLAPSLGMAMLGKDLVEIIEEFVRLATALGADLSVSAEAKTAFDQESSRLRDAIGAVEGKTVLAVSRDPQTVYVANADQHPDLAYLKSLGAEFVDAGSKATDYFSEISYEELDRFSGDLIIDDQRNRAANAEVVDAQPTWKALPAVKAGRVAPWQPAAPYSYLASVPVLQGFTDAYGLL